MNENRTGNASLPQAVSADICTASPRFGRAEKAFAIIKQIIWYIINGTAGFMLIPTSFIGYCVAAGTMKGSYDMESEQNKPFGVFMLMWVAIVLISEAVYAFCLGNKGIRRFRYLIAYGAGLSAFLVCWLIYTAV